MLLDDPNKFARNTLEESRSINQSSFVYVLQCCDNQACSDFVVKIYLTLKEQTDNQHWANIINNGYRSYLKKCIM